MANNKAAEKTTAVSKKSNIDKYQKEMMLAIGATCVVLGITLVVVIYLFKVIVFNGEVISTKDSTIDDYIAYQKSLENLNKNVAKLLTNENLESVASARSSICDKYKNEDGKYEFALDDIQTARTCSSLRVIADTLPSKENMEATLASLTGLAISGSKNIQIIQGLSESTSYGTSMIQYPSSVKTIGASISFNGSATEVNGAIGAIENSIRNFDIRRASLNWRNQGKLEFNAVYTGYYSGEQEIQFKHKVVCSDDTSEACKKAKSRVGVK